MAQARARNLPAGRSAAFSRRVGDTHNELPSAWGKLAGFGTVFYEILPFIEQREIYQLSQGDVATWADRGQGRVQSITNFPIDIYLCPSDTTAPEEGLWPRGQPPAGKTEIGKWAFSNYGVNYQMFGNPKNGNHAPSSNPRMAIYWDWASRSDRLRLRKEYRKRNGHGAI